MSYHTQLVTSLFNTITESKSYQHVVNSYHYFKNIALKALEKKAGVNLHDHRLYNVFKI